VTFLRTLVAGLTALLRRRRRFDEIDEEIGEYLQADVDARVARGEHPDSAKRNARLAFGNPVSIREAETTGGWAHLLESAVQDTALGVRLLGRNPGMSGIVIATLALAIGGNASVLALVNTIYFRPLPIAAPERVYRLQSSYRAGGDIQFAGVPGAHVDALRSSARFEAITAATADQSTLIDGGGPERITVVRRSAGWQAALGISPAIGRDFTSVEEARGESAGVAILSHHLWTERYGSAPPQTLTVRINGHPFTIVGVMPPGYRFPYLADVWIPASIGPGDPRDYAVFARVTPGTSRTRLESALTSIAAGIRQTYPSTPPGYGIIARTLRDNLTEGEERPTLALLLLVVFLFAIACLNVTALMVARAVAREKEFAVRAALGATRDRLLRQLVSETAVLAVFGGTAGILLALWIMPAISIMIPSNIREQLGLAAPSIDLRVLAATGGLIVFAAIAAGILPGLRGVRASAAALAQGGRSTQSDSPRVRCALSSFVALQVACATVLLAGAAATLQHLREREHRDLGFASSGLVTAQLSPPRDSYPPGNPRAALVSRVVTALSSVAGMDSVAASTMNPLGGATWAVPVLPEGAPVGAEPVNVTHQLVTPPLFRTMGIPLRSGRDIDNNDIAGRTRVAVVSETLARRLWPDRSPIGNRLRMAFDDAPFVTVIGVVGDVSPPPGSDLAQATWYLPYAQLAGTRAADDVQLMIRTSGTLQATAAALAEAVHRIDGGLAIYGVRAMDEYYASTLRSERLAARGMAAIAVFALLLVAVGTYGVLALSVAARSIEFSIRGALGATAHDIRLLVLRQSLLLTTLGLVLGAAAAVPVVRMLGRLLASSAPVVEPAVVTSVAALLIVSVVASALPANRAGELAERKID
jgi:putative ABC transport system permease protein